MSAFLYPLPLGTRTLHTNHHSSELTTSHSACNHALSSRVAAKRPRATLADVRSSKLPSTMTKEKTKPFVDDLRKLSTSSGALGRGVRAILRAFYRRANFVLPRRAQPNCKTPIYVEIGPAYALTMARFGREKVTRYAVEQRAWPVLRSLLHWDEFSTCDARQHGAPLRPLFNGNRYGRHVFISYSALSAMILVAEDLLADVNNTCKHDDISTDDPLAAILKVQIEAVIELRRRPIAGIRTVAANCPRGEAHSNRDRNPSLMLWMNDDGVTGGAMCPVCMEPSSSLIQGSHNGVTPSTPRHMTWRVHYVQGNTAVLCTPHRRIQSPPLIGRAVDEWRQRHLQVTAVNRINGHARLKSVPTDPPHVLQIHPTDSAQTGSHSRGQKTSPVVVEPHDGLARSVCGTRRHDDTSSAIIKPVGGMIMRDKKKLTQMGKITSLAYVTASLKIEPDLDTDGTHVLNASDGVKLRTIGAKARLSCPMQILLWGERRSKGPTQAQRVEDVSWFARQSLISCDDEGHDDINKENEERLESEEWLPTPVLSVSAMRPSGWRDVLAGSGQLVSVPSGWEPAAQAWVLFDLDDVQLVENCVDTVAAKIILAVRRNLELSGRCLVLQTGPCGLHVWAELREVREDARSWFKLDDTRNWYMDVGTKLLKAAHRGGATGGKVDPSSCCSGRFARRPGWRLLEDGTAFRSRVVTYVLGRVKSRKPRI